ncbi:ATP-dependent Clp protease ATP-binding subunit [candidate division WWE3 bacterium]|nr:ATP-dependent Clp protease ATP-binding subunit [candidate division WWE3 bacterium]
MAAPTKNVVNYRSRFFNNMLLFPVWYLVYAFDFWYQAGTRILIILFDMLGIGPIIRHLFASYRRDPTWVGRAIGIIIRLFWLTASLALLGSMLIAVLATTAIYYLAPFMLLRWAPLPFFFFYLIFWFGVYMYILWRQDYWEHIRRGEIIFLPEIRRVLWKRLELSFDDVDPLFTRVIEKPENWKEFVDYLRKRGLHEDDFFSARDWILRKEYRKQSWKFWRDEFFVRRIGVNVGWVAGFLPELKRFSIDLTQEAVLGHLPHVFGREKELNTMLQVLVRPSRNNVLLVGEAGVGKTSLVYSISWFILGRYADVNIPGLADLVEPLRGRRVIELNAAGFVGGMGDRGSLENRLNEVLHELTDGETVLFINQLENLIQTGMIGYLAPLIGSTQFPIIATTTPKVLNEQLSPLSEFMSEFEVIQIKPPSLTEAVRILEGVVNEIEMKTGCFFTYPAIVDAIEMSERYIHNAVLPDKAIKVLVKAGENSRNQEIHTKQIENAIAMTTGIPVGDLSSEETDKLLNLERLLKERIIGQTEAVEEIAKAVRRARTGVSSNQRPIASLLFLGPTGVGKTLTAKTLAQVYFTPSAHSGMNDQELNRLIDQNFMQYDMSEFSEPGSVSVFVQRLTQESREKPFSLLLLDEFEKSEDAIRNLFLQILEEGRLTNAKGESADFRNTIIIATSNAITDLPQNEKTQDRIRERLEKAFRPELINRFDGIVVFTPLGANEIHSIVLIELAKLQNRLKQEREIKLTWTESLVTELSKIGVDPEYGARPLRRIIQDRIEDSLARKILRHELQYGDEYELSPQDLNT